MTVQDTRRENVVAHGTKYRYGTGCRCEPCRAAKREEMRQYRARARAEARPAFFRNMEASRAAKHKRVGTCVDCGAETHYNGRTVNGPSLRCAPCGSRCAAEIAKSRAGEGPQQRRVRDLVASGVTRYGQLRDRLGITPGHASVLLTREVQEGRLVRVARGEYRLPGGAAVRVADRQEET